MTQRHCENCGAPLKHSYNHKCEYCGTLFDFNEPEDRVVEVKPENLVNINLRNVHHGIGRNSLVFTFDGYKCEMPKVYEANDNIYVSKIQEYVNPPKCGFAIELSIDKLEQYGLDYALDAILQTGIRYNELDNVRVQLIEKLKQNYRRMII